MNSIKGSARARLMTTTLLAGLAAIAAPATVFVAAGLAPATALAQDYTSGTLSGTVKDTSGAAVPGAAVVVKSLTQGFERNVTTDSNGQFRVPLIPTGGYSVAISKEGYRSTADGNVSVALGSSAYTFTLASDAEAVSEVVITATANPQLDFAGTTTGLVVDLETLTKRVPIARSVTAVALLAPTVVRGGSSSDATFANQPSIGGSSIAENAYYVNGLNITNFNTYIGGATVPFDFYKTIEVKTGGYPAEFGRSTGGVLNAVTKSGGNDFHFAVRGNWSPSSLTEQSKDTFQNANHRDYDRSESLTFEASGPIIEDRLFFYVMNQQQKVVSKFASKTTNSYNIDTRNDPFWGVKLDGYITDKQHLEFTWLDTTRQTDRRTYGYDGDTDVVGSQLQSTTAFQAGAPSWVGKYTGSFTDWFTLSAAYGISKDRDNTIPGNSADPLVNDLRSGTTSRISQQSNGNNDFPLNTKREFYRVDADLYFNLFGKHHIRGGFDEEKLTLEHFTERTGGVRYQYRRGSASNAQGVAAGQDYLELQYFRTGGEFSGKNRAYYIQDSWDVADTGLTLNLGVRLDKFASANAAGENFVEFDKEIGPRIGFTYDPTGDGMNKVFGNFGRYYLPVASNTAYRQGASELFFREFYNAPAGGFVIDPVTGLPAAIGSQITQATNPGFVSAAPCPAGGRGPAGLDACSVTSDGSVLPTIAAISRNLKSTFEDEYILGYERRFNSLWTGRVVLSYKNMGRVSEDVAIDAAVLKYCAAQGISGCEDIWTGFHQYVIVNPGFDQTIVLRDTIGNDAAGTLREINFTAADLNYPKAKREYLGLEVSFERAFDGKWGLQGSYVLSESKGNYEGFVKSDVGQDDAGITQDFDQPGLTEGSYGYLPNHRGHQFKLFGSYAVTDSLLVGANYSLLSPKKFACFGFHPTDAFAQVYGAAAFYCDGKQTPRGSVYQGDWNSNLDLSLRYTVPAKWSVGGNLVLRADVFNVFNSKAVTDTWEFGEVGGVGDTDPNYKSPTGYQAPRSIRFGFDLEF
ncbi:TonB-dependent receptor [Caulobacter segnis]|nr:TonB-dependent receptor [Caulobacter segnis]